MADTTETLNDASRTPPDRSGGPPAAGLLLVFSAGRPLLTPIPLGGRLVVGRGSLSPDAPDDARMSRQHAAVSFEGGRWRIEDFGSRNGTFVDGAPVSGTVESRGARILRTGDTLFLLCPDVTRYRSAAVEIRKGVLIGPALREAWDAVARAARLGDVVHLCGETGSGKELAARHFHEQGPRRAGPFVAINCATVPAAIAERLLFGARRGAYSGAETDSEGYVQAADGGTLFLDEVGELAEPVQAKLLRVLESREVMQLGASRARKVDFGLCSATHADLRARVAATQFREDLYFRIARPQVTLPPLRERPEDAAWLVAHALGADPAVVPHASLIETILLRPWPGNVRELVSEVRSAAQLVVEQGNRTLRSSHLAPGAGLGGAAPGREPPVPQHGARPIDRDAVERALKEQQGNVTAAARALGLHRNQLRRLLARFEIDPKLLGDEG